jgi:hypothetical protein
MMNLGHMVLISSCAVIITGVLLTALSGIDASRPFLNQNILVANEIIKPGESRTSTENVTVTGPVMYVVIKSDPSNMPINALVRDPNGSVVSVSTFSQDLVANFKPQITGKYQLVITNQGAADVRTNIILGYLALFGENEKPNYGALGAIFTGALLLIFGCFGFVVGLRIYIKDKSSKIEQNIYCYSKRKIGRIVDYFTWGRGRFKELNSVLPVHPETTRNDDQLERLEKLREEGLILESEFLEKKKEFTLSNREDDNGN